MIFARNTEASRASLVQPVSIFRLGGLGPALSRLKQVLPAGAVQGTAWMVGAEMLNRISRIATALVLARMFTTAEFGMMALILTTYEIVRMLIHNGLGARIACAGESEIDSVACAVWRINWAVGLAMCCVQIAIAIPVQAFFGAGVAPMLAVLGLVHLIYPIGMVHSSLALRGNRLRFTAALLGFQITMDNLLTAGLALAGFGVWSAVAPKLIIAAAWAGIHLACVPGWRWQKVPRPLMWEVTGFAKAVFCAEALNTLRANADKLIVGKVLGIEAFGIYSFAANAGAGITTGLSNALGQAALPYMSGGAPGAAQLLARFRIVLKGMCAIVLPVILAQTVLAPWYVPFFFGERWAAAVPALMLMCLATLVRPLAIATSQLLRTAGHVALELKLSKWNAGFFFTAIFAGLPFGVEGVAAALFIATSIPAIAFVRIAMACLDNCKTLPAGQKGPRL